MKQFDAQCKESVTGSHSVANNGKCSWCNKKVEAAIPAPNLGRRVRTEMDDAYRYHFDPNWGSDSFDD